MKNDESYEYISEMDPHRQEQQWQSWQQKGQNISSIQRSYIFGYSYSYNTYCFLTLNVHHLVEDLPRLFLRWNTPDPMRTTVTTHSDSIWFMLY